MNDLISSIAEFCTQFGIKLLFAALCLVVGIKLTKVFIKALSRSRGFRILDEGLQSFIKSIIKIVLYVLIFITAASIIGIPTTSFLTMLASAGLAVGLALQGSLSNFAGGIMILFFKPFKIGDYIETVSKSGTVKAINVFYTVLHTVDNKTITVPNGSVANSDIVNYSAEPTRRVDLTVSVSYDAPIDKTKAILLGCAAKSTLSLSQPEPFVGIISHAESSVDFVLRVWCKTEDYWQLYFELTESVKLSLDENGIEIPYKQIDVHVKSDGEVKNIG